MFVVIVELIILVMFGFIVCIKRKFDGFFFCFIICEMCVVIGIVEIFVELMRGFILLLESLYIILLNIILLIVVNMKVKRFKKIIVSVFGFRNLLVVVVVLIESFKKIVMMLIRVFWVVLDNFLIILYFLKRLLSIRYFISGVIDGKSRDIIIVIVIGKIIFLSFEIFLSWFILIICFFFVVKSFIIGG